MEARRLSTDEWNDFRIDYVYNNTASAEAICKPLFRELFPEFDIKLAHPDLVDSHKPKGWQRLKWEYIENEAKVVNRELGDYFSLKETPCGHTMFRREWVMVRPKAISKQALQAYNEKVEDRFQSIISSSHSPGPSQMRNAVEDSEQDVMSESPDGTRNVKKKIRGRK